MRNIMDLVQCTAEGLLAGTTNVYLSMSSCKLLIARPYTSSESRQEHRADANSTFQLLFYALRPGFIRSQKPTIWHAYNILTILLFDTILVKTCSWNALVYLILSSFFAGSLHPCAAHFIAEHYLMNDQVDEIIPGSAQDLGKETTSYYGWLNILCYNVSIHPPSSSLHIERSRLRANVPGRLP